MKTAKELETLKENWKNDPCWNIEETEGFEEHHDELLAFREASEKEWDEKWSAKLKSKAAMMGIPSNLVLTRYIMMLEDKIERLEGDMIAIGDRLPQ